MSGIHKALLIVSLLAGSAFAQPAMVPIDSGADWIYNLDAPRQVGLVAADQYAIPDAVLQSCQSIGLVISSEGNSQSRGSATYIGDGLWLTNAHVVLGGRSFTVQTKDGRTHAARLLRVEHDREPDLALLETADMSWLDPVPIANGGVTQGDIVFPSGFDRGDLARHKAWPARVVHFYNGDVESVGFGQRSGAISGNSGGPTFNAAGELISPLNANGGSGSNDTQTGRGTTITVCWRSCRTFLLPWRERIVRAIERMEAQRRGVVPTQQCPPGSYYCPPQYSQPSYPQQPQGPDYSQTVPPSFQPAPPATTTEIDYDKLVTLLADDPRFRGPQGEQGPQGPAGPRGEAGQLSDSQVSAMSATLLAALRSDPTFRGPKGDRGEDGPAGDGNRRVVLMADGKKIDDEVYAANEPIVLDLKKIIRAAQ